MKSPWPTKKLGEIIEEKKEKNRDGLNLPVYTVSHLFGLIPYQEIFYKRIHSIDTSNYKIVSNGDFAFGLPTKTALPFGLLEEHKRVLVSPAYIVFRIIKNELNCKFLYYLFLTNFYKKLIINLAACRGATRHGLPLKFEDLANLEIPLPPLSEQQKIVYVLDTIQEAVRVQEKLIEKTKELKRAMMAKLFREGTSGEKLKKTEIGEIPESWEVIDFERSLNKKIKFKVGELKKEEYRVIGKYPVIDQGESKIVGYSDKIELVYDGPLPVVIFGDHTRVVKFIDFPFIVGGGGVKILIPTNEFDVNFFYYYLSTLKIESRGYNRHFGVLKQKMFLKPPLSDQREIAEILQTFDEKIEIEKKKKELYEELFKTMLNKLMTGQLRITDYALTN